MYRDLGKLPVLSGFAMAMVAFALSVSAQITGSPSENNPFAPNPTASQRIDDELPVRTDSAKKGLRTGSSIAIISTRDENSTTVGSNRTNRSIFPYDPTSEYRIGVGDMIRIDILNVKAGPRYFKIGDDGRIAYQLAGGTIEVIGKTTTELEADIRGLIRIYRDPNVNVQVREYASHVVSIRGAVQFPGDHQIQRDALPFYVIRAKVMPDRSARSVRVTRKSVNTVSEYRLVDSALYNLNIFPGDLVEFFD